MQPVHLTLMMLSLAVLPILTAASSPSSALGCSTDALPTNGTMGINAGGCWRCTGTSGEAVYGVELEDLCLRTCLADPECRSFEYIQLAAIHAIDFLEYPYYPLDGPMNCCIQHATPEELAAAYPTLSATNMTGDCKRDFTCWSARKPMSSCPSDITTPPTCTRGHLSWTNADDDVRIAGMEQNVADGCRRLPHIAEAVTAIRDAFSRPGGDTCVGTESAEYYLAVGLATLQPKVVLVFGVIIPILWVLPAILLLARCWLLGCIRRCRRRAPSTPTNASAQCGATPSASSVAASNRLASAESEARKLRSLVGGVTAQLGWMLVSGGFIPMFANLWANISTYPITGEPSFYMAGIPWGTVLMALTLRPIDATAIRYTCICQVCFCVFGCFVAASFGLGFASFADAQTSLRQCIIAAIFSVSALLIVLPTLTGSYCGHGKNQSTRAMPPRRMLLRLWLSIRLILVMMFAIMVESLLRPLWYGLHYWRFIEVRWSTMDYRTGTLVAFANALFAAVISTSSNRGRFLYWLSARLATGGTKQQEAAAIASILGDSSAATTLAMSEEKFRAWPMSSLSPEHFDSNEPDSTLFSLTEHAALGAVHGFVSHSWSDEGRAKYDRLREWAGRLGVGKDAETLLWVGAFADLPLTACVLLVLNLPLPQPELTARVDFDLSYADKACIDQLNIDESLACLPIFLAGCQKLLLLVGPTYASRLWCVMEIYIFVKMGGERGAMDVMLLDESADAALVSHLARFDASKAMCFYDRDRQRLWAVIESSFGTFDPFNKLVRGLIAERVWQGAGEAIGKEHDEKQWAWRPSARKYQVAPVPP